MVACTHVDKQTRYATPDMILVEAPGLPYTKSVYAAGPEFLSFFAEYLELVKVAKPVMQVFPITSERCITKVCLFEFLEHLLESCSMYVSQGLRCSFDPPCNRRIVANRCSRGSMVEGQQNIQ